MNKIFKSVIAMGVMALAMISSVAVQAAPTLLRPTHNFTFDVTVNQTINVSGLTNDRIYAYFGPSGKTINKSTVNYKGVLQYVVVPPNYIPTKSGSGWVTVYRHDRSGWHYLATRTINYKAGNSNPSSTGAFTTSGANGSMVWSRYIRPNQHLSLCKVYTRNVYITRHTKMVKCAYFRNGARLYVKDGAVLNGQGFNVYYDNMHNFVHLYNGGITRTNIVNVGYAHKDDNAVNILSILPAKVQNSTLYDTNPYSNSGAERDARLVFNACLSKYGEHGHFPHRTVSIYGIPGFSSIKRFQGLNCVATGILSKHQRDHRRAYFVGNYVVNSGQAIYVRPFRTYARIANNYLSASHIVMYMGRSSAGNYIDRNVIRRPQGSYNQKLIGSMFPGIRYSNAGNREAVAIDGSLYNQFYYNDIQSYPWSKRTNGIDLYTNSGEKGMLRPMGSFSNYLYSNTFKGFQTGIYLGVRDNQHRGKIQNGKWGQWYCHFVRCGVRVVPEDPGERAEYNIVLSNRIYDSSEGIHNIDADNRIIGTRYSNVRRPYISEVNNRSKVSSSSWFWNVTLFKFIGGIRYYY